MKKVYPDTEQHARLLRLAENGKTVDLTHLTRDQYMARFLKQYG